jgi:hypothetical protein
MAKSRSPSYPAIGLKEAIARVGMVYAKDHLNQVPKAVIAEHMGYKGLSGASLPILAALNQYGLLEGRGDETQVSQRALNIIVHEPGSSSARLMAMREAAFLPDVFSELVDRFRGGNPSDAAIRAHLLSARFIPAAADTVVRSYRETNGLLEAEEEAYKRANPIQAEMVEMDARIDEAVERGEYPFLGKAPLSRTKPASVPPNDAANEPVRVGTRREVFALTEGDVVLSFPSNLSHESYADLESYLQIFLRRAKRMAAYSHVGPDADRWHEALTKPKDDSAI